MPKPCHVFLLIILTCLHCLGQAQVRNLPPGAYTLNSPGNPSEPFPALLNFNDSLTQQGTDAVHRIPVRRYPIIPPALLSAFFNRLAGNNQLPALAGTFTIISNNMRDYAGNALVDCSVSMMANNLVEASNLSAAMGSNWIRGNGTRSAPGMPTFSQYYSWLPGNLYVGTSARSDAPAQGELDSNAIRVVGQSYMQRIENLYNYMNEYLKSDNVTLLARIDSELSTVAQRTDVFPLTANRWILSDGQYKLNVNIPIPAGSGYADKQEQRRTSTVKHARPFNNTSCAGLTPTLPLIKARIHFMLTLDVTPANGFP